VCYKVRKLWVMSGSLLRYHLPFPMLGKEKAGFSKGWKNPA